MQFTGGSLGQDEKGLHNNHVENHDVATFRMRRRVEILVPGRHRVRLIRLIKTQKRLASRASAIGQHPIRNGFILGRLN